MLSKTYTITFTGHYQGQEYSLQTYGHEYRNLMELLKDRICPEDFGECGGMGRCGTCLANITGLANNSGESYKNEQGKLSKMGILDPATRLCCQVQVDESLNDTTIEILDAVY